MLVPFCLLLMAVIGGVSVPNGFHIGPQPPDNAARDREYYSQHAYNQYAPRVLGPINRVGTWTSLTPAGKILCVSIVLITAAVALFCGMLLVNLTQAPPGLLSMTVPAALMGFVFLVISTIAEHRYGGPGAISDFFLYGSSVLITGLGIGIFPCILFLLII